MKNLMKNIWRCNNRDKHKMYSVISIMRHNISQRDRGKREDEVNDDKSGQQPV